MRKCYDRSCKNLESYKEFEEIGSHSSPRKDTDSWESITTSDCGYLQLPYVKDLVQVAIENKSHIHITRLPGTFVFHNEVLIKTSNKIKSEDHNFSRQISVDSRVPVELHETGIKHLVEVAVKGCSPAINDPGTSLSALDYVTQLLIKRENLKGYNRFSKDGNYFVYIPFLSNEMLVDYCFEELWNYMKHDPLLVKALKSSITRLNKAGVSVNHAILS